MKIHLVFLKVKIPYRCKMMEYIINYKSIKSLYHFHVYFNNLPKLPVLGSDFQHLQDHGQIPAPQPEDALAPHNVHTPLEEPSARCAGGGSTFWGGDGGRLGGLEGWGGYLVKMMRKSGENGMSGPWK